MAAFGRTWGRMWVVALVAALSLLGARPAAAESILSDPGDPQAGKAAASSEPIAEEAAANAFAAGTEGKWLGNMDEGGAWLEYTFKGDGYAVAKYKLISGNDEPSRDPKTWKVLGSNDGKDWATLDERTDQSFDDRGVTNVYKVKEPKVFKIYRLAISANNGSTEDQTGGKGIVQLARWLLLADATAAAGTDTVITGEGEASASSEPIDAEKAPGAFDGDNETKWLGNMEETGAWLQYTFKGDGAAASKYKLVSANDAPERDPKEWKVLGSNDGKDWTTLDEQKDQTFADRFTANSYTLKAPKAYKYYRLRIVANNGSTEDNLGGKGLVQLADWRLIK